MPSLRLERHRVVLDADGNSPDFHSAAMLAIFLVSLFAVSFPGVSKQVPVLRIPHILFFIGKHFGTGVILSTAFCHLLPDAFTALQDAAVRNAYGNVGKWTGQIILASLLAIFLVEYTSTSYVDYLHAESSVPPSPSSSPASSQPRTPTIRASLLSDAAQDLASTTGDPLLTLSSSHPLPTNRSSSSRLPTTGLATETTPLLPQPPKRTKSLCNLRDEALLPLIMLNSPRLTRGGMVHSSLFCNDLSCVCPTGRKILAAAQACELEGRVLNIDNEDEEEEKQKRPRIGRKRQIIGILVLQLGIMIHSLVIGLTLAVTTGYDFTSLVTAIIFHQLFEGLSLGIRIAALPPAQHETEPASGTTHWRLKWLSPLLSILFAITTPLGMLIGAGLFPVNPDNGTPGQAAEMRLTQGIMSAISAGLLIYAATVEMMAGDFVYGDAGGDHGHTHDHSLAHEHGHEHHHTHQLHPLPEPAPAGSAEAELGTKHARSGAWRRVLAVCSLLAGVGGMVLVGIGE